MLAMQASHCMVAGGPSLSKPELIDWPWRTIRSVVVLSVAAVLLPACTAEPIVQRPPLLESDAQRIELALTSENPTEVVSVVSEVVQGGFGNGESLVLPRMSVLDLDTAEFTATGDTATVPATMSGPQPGRWLLLLQWEDDSWHVYGTRPL